MMDRTTRPLVIVAAFAGSLVVGLVLCCGRSVDCELWRRPPQSAGRFN